ncbi:TetR/AcrR family transcriptional regulator [Kitasatospora sp. DSM 101779]|uniref:TetR/AcrR family transcriptional regulator n=1 Tax=Kitasatospora sp. DSM 101779 TaxID=2853165 RepID=UPI0021D80764|nr:TetR/AcrR family transcriptional regulator [Kitasatospora sp. DSM 101779]MCU7820593.1 TetR/AcrR family transcriptional regulator [Kitasatospora sp. DSM 101779]
MPAPQPAQKATQKARRPRLSAEDRRASILDAATEVFSELGYQRGKMSEVARRVGVSEPVVFQNFGSKSAVFAAVLDHAAALMSDGLRSWAGRCPTVGAWLAELLAPEHLAHVHARGTVGVLFEDAMTLTSEPEVLEAARRGNRALARTLTDLLEQGRADGSLRPDVDPAAGAWWLISLLSSQHFRQTVAPDPADTEAALVALTLRLLMPESPAT